MSTQMVTTILAARLKPCAPLHRIPGEYPAVGVDFLRTFIACLEF